MPAVRASRISELDIVRYGGALLHRLHSGWQELEGVFLGPASNLRRDERHIAEILPLCNNHITAAHCLNNASFIRSKQQ